MYKFFTGLLLTAGGAGGVENSVTDLDLLLACAISAIGLGIMFLATNEFKYEA